MNLSEHKITYLEKPAVQRYEVLVDGVVAGVERYLDNGSTRVLIHTEIYPRFEGMGLASKLVAWVLDDIRAAGRTMRPECRYVVSFLQRHPQYQDLVA